MVERARATGPSRARGLPPWRRLGWRLGAAFVAVTAMAILVGGGLQYRAQAEGIRDSLGGLLLNIARTGALLVDPALHLEVQLTRTAGGGIETLIRPEDRKLLPPGLTLSRDGLTNRAKATQYAVEYRIALDSTPWREYGRYPTQQEAQRSLFFAIEQGRIPRPAETRIVLK